MVSVMLAGNINSITKLMRIIGTPFNPPEKIASEAEIMGLYELAKKNKIGLLFLESINTPTDMEQELRNQRDNQEIVRGTARRVANVLNSADSKYAVIKSTYQFPVTPNDVDVLIFDANGRYESIVDVMRNNKFDLMGIAPTEAMFHDASRGQHSSDSLAKDPFDADLYREVGAGHIIYMDKNKLSDKIKELNIDGTRVRILTPAAEMALSIFHSIYPERLFTLLLYYHVLYSIKEMTEKDRLEFVRICDEQKLRNATLLVLSIIENIHETVFREPIRELSSLRESFGKRRTLKIDSIPYNYTTREMLSSFWGKKSDLVFTSSFIKQIIFMLNPKYAKYVLREFKHRERRDTY